MCIWYKTWKSSLRFRCCMLIVCLCCACHKSYFTLAHPVLQSSYQHSFLISLKFRFLVNLSYNMKQRLTSPLQVIIYPRSYTHRERISAWTGFSALKVIFSLMGYMETPGSAHAGSTECAVRDEGVLDRLEMLAFDRRCTDLHLQIQPAEKHLEGCPLRYRRRELCAEFPL